MPCGCFIVVRCALRRVCLSFSILITSAAARNLTGIKRNFYGRRLPARTLARAGVYPFRVHPLRVCGWMSGGVPSDGAAAARAKEKRPGLTGARVNSLCALCYFSAEGVAHLVKPFVNGNRAYLFNVCADVCGGLFQG